MPTGATPVAVIFGGAGFIGTHLTERLLRDGFEVVIADITEPVRALPGGVRVERVDVREKIELDVGTPQLVFNLAAVHRTPGHPEHEYYETNVRGALNVTTWCDETAAQTLAFTSSISVYGPTEKRKTESSALTPNSSYGRSKLLAEEIHHEWQRRSGRKLVVARPAVVFGPAERGNFTRLAAALRRGRFVYPGRDDTLKACGYVTDLVGALLFAVDLPEERYTFNYCYPEAPTIREICDAFQEVAGYKAPRRLPPSLVAVATSGFARVPASSRSETLNPERIRKLTASTNIVPEALVTSGFTWQTDLRSALAAWLDATPRGDFV